MKKCTTCNAEKASEEFPFRDKATGKRASWCRKCYVIYSAEYHAKNKERHNAKCREYQAANKSRLAENAKEYRAKNKDTIASKKAAYGSANSKKLAEISRARHKANKEKDSIVCKVYREKNRDFVRAITKAWKAENPEALRAYNQNRRAMKRERGGKLSADLPQRLFTLQRGKCACCGGALGDDYHLDHRMPLALGGTNTDDNIQLLTAKCNMQKSAKHPADYMRERGFLL